MTWPELAIRIIPELIAGSFYAWRLEPWMNPNTRHEHRSGRWPAPLQPQRGQGQASPEPRDGELGLPPQVVLAPDEEDALRGRPNLGRRIPIARLATTQGVDGI